MKTQHSTESFEDKIDRLSKESMVEHRKDVESRIHEYRDNFRKWRIFMILLHWICPKFHLYLYTKRVKVRRSVHKILTRYIPLIEDQLILKQKFFNLWEEENSGPELSASKLTTCRERDADDQLKDLTTSMVSEIKSVIDYDKWFYSIEDPRELIENPYPGYMDIRRSFNYCGHLLEEFYRWDIMPPTYPPRFF